MSGTKAWFGACFAAFGVTLTADTTTTVPPISAKDAEVYRAVAEAVLAEAGRAKTCPFVWLDDRGTPAAVPGVTSELHQRHPGAFEDSCASAGVPIGPIQWRKAGRAYVPVGFPGAAGRPCGFDVGRDAFGRWKAKRAKCVVE
jgi:hypothetical protein